MKLKQKKTTPTAQFKTAKIYIGGRVRPAKVAWMGDQRAIEGATDSKSNSQVSGGF